MYATEAKWMALWEEDILCSLHFALDTLVEENIRRVLDSVAHKSELFKAYVGRYGHDVYTDLVLFYLHRDNGHNYGVPSAYHRDLLVASTDTGPVVHRHYANVSLPQLERILIMLRDAGAIEMAWNESHHKLLHRAAGQLNNTRRYTEMMTTTTSPPCRTALKEALLAAHYPLTTLLLDTVATPHCKCRHILSIAADAGTRFFTLLLARGAELETKADLSFMFRSQTILYRALVGLVDTDIVDVILDTHETCRRSMRWDRMMQLVSRAKPNLVTLHKLMCREYHLVPGRRNYVLNLFPPIFSQTELHPLLPLLIRQSPYILQRKKIRALLRAEPYQTTRWCQQQATRILTLQDVCKYAILTTVRTATYNKHYTHHVGITRRAIDELPIPAATKTYLKEQ